MSTIDVRGMKAEDPIKKIVFGEHCDSSVILANYLTKGESDRVRINDSNSFVYLTNKQHAIDLKTALDKAIELGWFGD